MQECVVDQAAHCQQSKHNDDFARPVQVLLAKHLRKDKSRHRGVRARTCAARSPALPVDRPPVSQLGNSHISGTIHESMRLFPG